MIVKNEFVIEAPVERAWELLDEVESMMSCMPGASYLGREGDNHKAAIKVKVGAITANFQGTVRFVEKDRAAHTARIHGAGKDLGGKAAATATIAVKLEPLTHARTKVIVETDLAMTGRLAQFGSGVMADIASRMVEQFSQNLHAAVLARSAATGPVVQQPEAEAVSDKEPRRPEPAVGASEPVAFDAGAALAPRILRYSAIAVAFIVVAWLLVSYLFK